MANLVKKTSKHPRLYTIFQPNELIKAKKFDMSYLEKRVYYHILNYNHTKSPDQLVYQIAYEDVLNPNDVATGNRKINAKRIANALQKRTFLFDSSFMKREFGEDAETAMNPFPEINCYDGYFNVQVWPRFKKILCMLGLGFTKGDLETLKSFQYEVSDNFYWLIRQHQVFANTWTVDLEELKERLDLVGRYSDWDNFKRKVLDKAKQDMMGTWAQFDFKPVKKGKGGSVESIVMYFKNGPKEEKEIGGREVYAWEENLLRHGVDGVKVREIVSRVNINQEAISKEKKIPFNWDQDYVRFSIEAMVSSLKEKKKDKNKKPVGNTGGLLYTGLMEGYWVEYVMKRKEQLRIEVQQTLNFASPELEAEPVEKLALPVARALKENSDIQVLNDQHVADWEELHKVSPLKDKTFEEFMNDNNFYLTEGKWVR